MLLGKVVELGLRMGEKISRLLSFFTKWKNDF